MAIVKSSVPQSGPVADADSTAHHEATVQNGEIETNAFNCFNLLIHECFITATVATQSVLLHLASQPAN
ncbi:unnamed protein product [Protopolystoma xenopodis]|uniref:Uncharacterized protein n=1 Tax=Protopolystoma xenopodis TaxID=117903 RepID=A0A448WQD7_9PLAT|nr:unnamed protein product [Protopolystoma xenopodis]